MLKAGASERITCAADVRAQDRRRIALAVHFEVDGLRLREERIGESHQRRGSGADSINNHTDADMPCVSTATAAARSTPLQPSPCAMPARAMQVLQTSRTCSHFAVTGCGPKSWSGSCSVQMAQSRSSDMARRAGADPVGEVPCGLPPATSRTECPGLEPSKPGGYSLDCLDPEE